MMWIVIWTDTAKKDFKKLPKNIQERIIQKIKQIESDPFTYLAKLSGTRLFKSRVGDYRLIIDVNNNKLHLHVIRVGKRSKIYGRLD